ncbi:hypothetical protein MVES1_000423 [Malassezia vespertilionis]|uniref:uncharacterized protein n=1 Tax=Malassezia vespertilionis TaxID=2020962 RepID=UPI0024B1F332|nr:uncharacterized protein MVES1_000423 [Malassezia vespertilionis]WFD05097.1 hypothetical protein MVES1_000423 [Malassezia vespertilionis]
MSSFVRGLPQYAVYGAPMDLLTRSLANTPTQITVPQLLAYGGTPGAPPSDDVLRQSAQYTQRELPVRLARRVRQFYSLPFIVGSNPWIQNVARLYASSFAALASIPDIQTQQDTDEFTKTLYDLVHDHSENVPSLASGFMECGEYMDGDKISNFLNAALHSRIGIRIIAEQHLALCASAAQARGEDTGGRYRQTSTSVGIIETQMRPVNVIRTSSEYVKALCEATFDIPHAPQVTFYGDVDVTMVGIPLHLEYVITELLKNAYRATTETWTAQRAAGGGPDTISPIEITIASTPSHVNIRISDKGGGIPPNNMNQIFNYAFTTANARSEETVDITAHAMDSSMGSLAGLGYGLPLSRLYLNYFGHSDLDIVSMWGYVWM